MPRLGVAVVGAGYWGPNLLRNFSAVTRTSGCAGCATSDGPGPRRAGLATAPSRATASLDDVLGDRGGRVRRDRDPGGAPTTTSRWPPSRPASTCWWRSRSRPRSTRAQALVEPRPPTRPGPDVRPHLLLHAGGRARSASSCAPACSATCSTSTPCGSTSASSSATSTCSGTSPRTTSRSSTSSCPTASGRRSVAAHGADPIGAGRACVAYLTLPLPGGAIAHVHVNWLSPTKIRTTIVGGSAKRMLVWDDLHPTQRISVFDSGVDLTARDGARCRAARRKHWSQYRSGDMVAPALPEREALARSGGRVRRRRSGATAPRSPTGSAGLRVLDILEAASQSLPSSRGAVRAADGVCGERSPAPARGNVRSSPAAPARSARPSSTSSSTPASPRSSCWTTSSAAGWPTWPTRSTAAPVRGRSTGTSATAALLAKLMAGVDVRLPPGRDPDHPVRRGAAARARGAGRRHVQRPRSGGRGRCTQGRRVVVGLGVRPGRPRSRRRRTTTRTRTTRSTARPRCSTRACCAASTTCTAWTTSRCATSTCTARGWTCTGSTPRCSSAGWSGSSAGEPPLILGDGAQTMDFVHVHDVAQVEHPRRQG